MSEQAAPERIAVNWSPEARADLSAIDRETAIQILHCLDRYLAKRTGDVKKLKPPETGFRLRCSDYRVFFDKGNETGEFSWPNRFRLGRTRNLSTGERATSFLTQDQLR